MRVLLAEDEPGMARLLADTLRRETLTVDRVASLEEARAALALAEYRLIVLDRQLRDGDGLELVRELSSGSARPAVVVLSAVDAPSERVQGLDAGADDYLAKPFDPDELRARVRAALRRTAAATGGAPVTCGRLSYHPVTREIAVGGLPWRLRRREAALLGVLMERVRRVVQRTALINAVYAFGEEPSSNTLDARISWLRRRLEAQDAQVAIRAVRGIGYVLEAA